MYIVVGIIILLVVLCLFNVFFDSYDFDEIDAETEFRKDKIEKDHCQTPTKEETAKAAAVWKQNYENNNLFS